LFIFITELIITCKILSKKIIITCKIDEFKYHCYLMNAIIMIMWRGKLSMCLLLTIEDSFQLVVFWSLFVLEVWLFPHISHCFEHSCFWKFIFGDIFYQEVYFGTIQNIHLLYHITSKVTWFGPNFQKSPHISACHSKPSWYPLAVSKLIIIVQKYYAGTQLCVKHDLLVFKSTDNGRT
jgi:hypothetical protein